MVAELVVTRPEGLDLERSGIPEFDHLVVQFVEQHMRQPFRDPMIVACNAASDVCMALFNVRVAVMPPHQDAPSFLQDLWEKTLIVTDEAFARRGRDPTLGAAARDRVLFRLVSTVPDSMDLNDYPWSEPSIDIDGVPAPSTFYKPTSRISDAELLRQCVLRALEMAGADYELGLGDNKIGKRLRREMRSLILASWWNRLRVTSRNANFAGGNDPDRTGGDPRAPKADHMMDADGFGLVLAPVHKDDLTRLAHGLPASRNVDLEGNKIGAGNEFPCLWIPAIDLQRLYGPNPTVTTEGLVWREGGRNRARPPLAVDKLGIDMNGVEFPHTESYQ